MRNGKCGFRKESYECSGAPRGQGRAARLGRLFAEQAIGRAQLAGNGAQAMGLDFADGVTRALEGANLCGDITESVQKQFTATADLWVTMGSNAVGWLGQGMESAGPALVETLARILFPGIHDEMQRSGVIPIP